MGTYYNDFIKIITTHKNGEGPEFQKAEEIYMVTSNSFQNSNLEKSDSKRCSLNT
jgi:hypothetical protein